MVCIYIYDINNLIYVFCFVKKLLQTQRLLATPILIILVPGHFSINQKFMNIHK